MKKSVALEPRIAGFKDYEDRKIGKSKVRVRVIFATLKPRIEIVDFRGLGPLINEEFSEKWRLLLPREEGSQRSVVFDEFQLGNMIVGTIEETGSLVAKYQKKELVYAYGPIRETLTTNDADGYKLRKLDRSDQWEDAVCYSPAQFALDSIREVHVRTGDAVAIFGLGAIGQIAIQLVKKAGVTTIVGIDPITQRRELVEKYGADYTLDPMKVDVGFRLKESIDKRGVDSVIETSGNAAALQTSLRGIDHGGIISCTAFARPFPAGFNLDREAYFSNAKIVFARASSEPNSDYPRWNRKQIEDTYWELSMNGCLDCEEITDPVVPFAKSVEAYVHYVGQHPEESIKMGVQVRGGEQ